MYVAIIIAFCFTACTRPASNTSASLSSVTDKQEEGQRFETALQDYEELLRQGAVPSDRMLYEMGILYSHPQNRQKKYRKAQACFQRLIDTFPESEYRRNSQLLLFQIKNVQLKDALIAQQGKQLDACHKDMQELGAHLAYLQQIIDAVNWNNGEIAGFPGIDKVLIEKGLRRLTLLSGGHRFKSYRIALGKNPVGPKEKQGDGKTPEGFYFIESRNRQSTFHFSLRLSYPNELDKKRAKELGVDPGGDIMIHGLKNGNGQVGSAHLLADWTEGCVAVTNREIEEISRLVSDGTPVEIRP